MARNTPHEFTAEDNALIRRMRADGVGWAPISRAIGSHRDVVTRHGMRELGLAQRLKNHPSQTPIERPPCIERIRRWGQVACIPAGRAIDLNAGLKSLT